MVDLTKEFLPIKIYENDNLERVIAISTELKS